MEDNPIKNDSRRVKSGIEIEKVRMCPFCRKLLPVHCFEDHHLVCEKNCSYLMLGMCKNCHRAQHVKLLDVGVTGEPPETWADKVVTILRALAVVFQTISELCWDLAEEGIQYFTEKASRSCKQKGKPIMST